MKKYYLLLFLLLNSDILYACEVSNKSYDFKYEIKNNYLFYRITSNNNDLYYYKAETFHNMPRELGFNIKNDIRNLSLLKNVSNGTIVIKSEIKDKFQNFYNENYKLYSLMNTGSSDYFHNAKFPLDKKNFIQLAQINEIIDLNKYFANFQSDTDNDFLFGKQIIKFKIKLILNENISSCLVFETKELEYNFGSKFKWYLKDILNIL